MATLLDKIKKVFTFQEKQPSTTVNVKEVGNTGTEITAGILTEEYLDALQGTDAADIFDKMRRSDSKIKMCIAAVCNPIKSATWEIEPIDDTPEAQKQADLATRCILESENKRWKQFLHEILTMVTFGYSLFERTHVTVKDDPEFGTFICFKDFGWRSPRTIENWNVDENEHLSTVDQFSDGDAQTNNQMDAKFLTLFTIEREGNNFEGISMLRPAYGSWLRKRVYQKLQAIGIEKYAVPTPVLKVPEGLENSDQFNNARTVLQNYTSHQSGFITLPAGWDLELNSNPFDADKVQGSIEAENSEMVNAFLANFLLLGQQGSGSYALSTDLSDFFLGGLDHIAAAICEIFNDQIIVELIDMNFGPQKEYPKMVCGGITDRAGKELSEVLSLLQTSKYIVPDDRLEDHLRKRYKLPPVSEDGQRKQEPPQPSPGFGGAPNPPPQSNPPEDQGSSKNPDPDENTDDIPNAVVGDQVNLVEVGGSIQFADPPRRQITTDSKTMRKLMQRNTFEMGQRLVDSLMRKLRASTPATRTAVPKGLSVTGKAAYNAELLDELTNISDEAFRRARSEVPKARNVELSEIKFAEFDRLPKETQRRLKAESAGLVESQAADLEKAVFFQFRSSVDQPDAMVEADLRGRVDEFSVSPSIVAAGGNSTARVINESRNAFFFDDDVQAQIAAFRFNNVAPKSAICTSLKGQIFDADDPNSTRFFPPLHHNCKSFLSPILVGGKKPETKPGGLFPEVKNNDPKLLKRAFNSITLSDKKPKK